MGVVVESGECDNWLDVCNYTGSLLWYYSKIMLLVHV